MSEQDAPRGDRNMKPQVPTQTGATRSSATKQHTPRPAPNTDCRIELIRTALRLLRKNGKAYKPAALFRCMQEYISLEDRPHINRSDINSLLGTDQHISASTRKLAEAAAALLRARFHDHDEVRAIIPLINGNDPNPDHSVHDAVRFVFGVEHADFQECSNYLTGTYTVSSYNFSSQMKTQILVVHPYELCDGVPKFSILYRPISDEDTGDIKNGYIIPIRNEFYVFCDISARMDAPQPSFAFVKKPPVKPPPSYAAGVYLSATEDGDPYAAKVIINRVADAMNVGDIKDRYIHVIDAIENSGDVRDIMARDEVLGSELLSVKSVADSITRVRSELAKTVKSLALQALT